TALVPVAYTPPAPPLHVTVPEPPVIDVDDPEVPLAAPDPADPAVPMVIVRVPAGVTVCTPSEYPPPPPPEPPAVEVPVVPPPPPPAPHARNLTLVTSVGTVHEPDEVKACMDRARAISAPTNAVVAICVVSVPGDAVGATGVPESDGDACALVIA